MKLFYLPPWHGRRDSSAQITTIEADDCVGLYGSVGGTTTPPHNSKRRSSLAQLGEFITSLGTRDKREAGDTEENRGRRGERGERRESQQPSRRGTLAEIR